MPFISNWEATAHQTSPCANISDQGGKLSSNNQLTFRIKVYKSTANYFATFYLPWTLISCQSLAITHTHIN